VIDKEQEPWPEHKADGEDAHFVSPSSSGPESGKPPALFEASSEGRADSSINHSSKGLLAILRQRVVVARLVETDNATRDRIFVIHRLTIGSQTIANIRASMAPAGAPLLIGHVGCRPPRPDAHRRGERHRGVRISSRNV
jgi:hypothetical protein